MINPQDELFMSIEKDLGSIVDYSIDILNINISPHEFKPDSKLRRRIVILLYEECKYKFIFEEDEVCKKIKNYIPELSIEVARIIKASPEFQESERKYLDQDFEKRLEQRKKDNNLVTLPALKQPFDCPALQDWPEHRQTSPTSLRRLENAGDFMIRLFESKLYDKKVYGEPFMPDIKRANPKLYYSLDKYQQRYEKIIVPYLSSKVNEVTKKVGEGVLTDIKSRTTATNKRYRQKAN